MKNILYTRIIINVRTDYRNQEGHNTQERYFNSRRILESLLFDFFYGGLAMQKEGFNTNKKKIDDSLLLKVSYVE